jgi:hypothetical protein
LKKQLHEIMGWPGPMTHRQYVAWQFWLAGEWNEPARGDWYVMALTAAVRQVLAKNPNAIKVEQQKLRFGGAEGKAAPPPQRSREQAAAASKARWGGFMAAKGEKAPPARGKG